MSESSNPKTNTGSQAAPDVLPMPLQAPGVVGALELLDSTGIRGWIYAPIELGVVAVSMFEGDHCLLTMPAVTWRNDVAHLRQGNGQAGFDAPIPDALFDGRFHELDFRLAGTGQSLIPRPIRVLPGRRPKAMPASDDAHAASTGGEGRAAPTVKFSFIVNFYNMQREAARTLTSLSRSYQRSAADIDYEVLCIDNGSDPPMDADWVSSFGPEFRLFTPSKLLPSPCAAINEAAREARGEYLAIMIDGAHLLTPGVFAEAASALAESPRAAIAVRHWFVGGDQRWLSAAGYSREMEDKIFTRIHWPHDGYQLFAAGAPMEESPTAWLDGLVESNCLFLEATLYDRIGGMDEAFSEPGGGFSNLDLFRRTHKAAEGGVVSLIGEASFHQYHEGTTTNVTDREKDARVRAYANNYRKIRGYEFKHIDRTQIRYRGRIKSDIALKTMKFSYMPLNLAVTDKIRPGRVHLHYDLGSQRYLQTAYIECGLHRLATWRGAQVGVAPTDLLNFQEIIRQTEPDCIITTSPDDGLIVFIDDVLRLLGLDKTRILRVAAAAPPGAVPARVRAIIGKHDAPETFARLESQVGTDETTLVLYAPAAGVAHPLNTLNEYAKFVSFRSYLIFLGTVFGQPWLGYSKNWYLANINKFVAASAFEIEMVWDRQLLSTCSSGYLRRVAVNDRYDPSLDQLNIFESTAP